MNSLGDDGSRMIRARLLRRQRCRRRYAVDRAQNRRSARQLLEFAPQLVCFGDAPPMRDTQPFEDFVARIAEGP